MCYRVLSFSIRLFVFQNLKNFYFIFLFFLNRSISIDTSRERGLNKIKINGFILILILTLCSL